MVLLYSLCLLWLLADPCVGAGEESLERQLYLDLFSNYSSQLRPIKTQYFEKIQVTVQFGLMQIENLNEKDQRLTTHGFMTLTWNDQLLQWDPAAYGGAPFLILPCTNVWLPELTAINSVADANEMAFDEDKSRVRIFADGTINWIPSMRWSTACAIDVSDFPYDEQECLIEFANWMYTGHLVNFTAIPGILNDTLGSNAEWNLIESTALVEEISDEFYTYPMVKLKLRMKRNPLYFELNVLLPAMLLSFLLIPMFILPVESGEKVSLGITLMLSYSIFLLMMTDVTPRSGTTPKLTVSILVCIVFSGIGMFLNILIINIHYHFPSKEVPGWVKRFAFNRLACVLCCMDYTEPGVKAFQVMPLPDDVMVEKTQKTLGKDFTNSDLAKLVQYLEYFKSKQEEGEVVEQNREDWNKLARVLDRLCLIIFILFFLVDLSVILGIKFAGE